MMNLKALILLILLPIFCVSQVKIKGKVLGDSKPVPFANVLLFDQTNQIIQGVVTDDAGIFEINAQKGNYKLVISYLGYEDYTKVLELIQDFTLDSINLVENQNILSEVVVDATKKKITRKIDRLVFNIQDSPIASSGNAFDVLKVSPGLVLKNDEIAMLGKSAVKVMVDGRMIQLASDELKSFLSSIDANDIKEIEIITNPSSKYEAEGNSGIVNIVYKKARKNSWSDNVSLSYKQAKYGSTSLKNNFSYQKNKISLLLSTGYDYGFVQVDQRAEMFYPDNPNKFVSSQKFKINDFSSRFLIDYNVNKTTKIGGQFLLGIKNNDMKDITTNTISNNSYTVESILKGRGQENSKKNNYSLNTHLEKKLDTIGRNMFIDLDYLEYNSEINNNILTGRYLPNNEFVDINFANKGYADQKITNFSNKIDFEHPLAFAKLSYGAKFSFSDTDYTLNNYNLIKGEPELNPSQSNQFEFKENIQSVYLSGSKKINEKWETQLGVRSEFTQTKGESKQLNRIDKNQYGKFFPTFYLTYTKNENNSFSFNYGKRIQRPNYSQLNPSRYYASSQISSMGNPYLTPSYNTNLDLTHTYKSNLTTKLSFNKTSNGYNAVSELIEATNEQITTFQNFYSNYGYSITETYQLKITPWWKTDHTLFLNYSESKKTNPNVDVVLRDGFEFYGAINSSLTLNKSKSFFGEVNFWYDSAYNDNLNHFSEAGALDIAFTYKAILKDLNLTVGCYDVFNSISRTISSEVNSINQTYRYNPSNRYFKISLFYNFGNNKISTNERNLGNDDVRSRSN